MGVMTRALSFTLFRQPPQTSPTFPVSGSFSSDVANCIGCARYMICSGALMTCSGPGTRYFATTSGSYTFTRADTNSATGFIRGTIGPARLVEWDYQAKAAIGGGDCFDLAPTTFEGKWP